MKTATLAMFVLWAATLGQAGPVSARPARDMSELATAETLRVGAAVLHRCADAQGWCGSLDRPLDPSGAEPDRIRIAYRWFPHLATGAPGGTLVTVQGGPGYGSIASASDFLAMTAALRSTRDLLVVDNRGTGASGALDCAALQRSHAQRIADVNACATQLARTGHLYGTGLAVEDMLAILDLLGTGKVDLYGDSYGTFFGQVFAAQAPERLRSLVLDGAYPARGGSPWYPELFAALDRTFAAVCASSPICGALPGTVQHRLQTLIERTRTAPPSGTVTDSNGRIRRITVDAPELFFVMANGGGGPIVFRELDAAGRAWLGDGDAQPLLRLAAEAHVTGDGTDQSTGARYYSKALFAAVSCSDYPQAYDLKAGFAERLARQTSAIMARKAGFPGTWAPFTFEEVRASPEQEDQTDLCLQWRWPANAPASGQPIAPDAPLTTAPTLVISGDLDVVTTPQESRQVASQFTNARFVRIANGFHVNALASLNGCAASFYARFVLTLDPGDTSCASTLPRVRTVARFARTALALDPATARTGNTGDQSDLRQANAVAQTAGDAVVRWWINLTGQATALRGGTYAYAYPSATDVVITLDRARWCSDLAVSGTVRWDQPSGRVRADLTTTAGGRWNIAWNENAPEALATINGSVGGRLVRAGVIAP